MDALIWCESFAYAQDLPCRPIDSTPEWLTSYNFLLSIWTKPTASLVAENALSSYVCFFLSFMGVWRGLVLPAPPYDPQGRPESPYRTGKSTLSSLRSPATLKFHDRTREIFYSLSMHVGAKWRYVSLYEIQLSLVVMRIMATGLPIRNAVTIRCNDGGPNFAPY